MNSIKQAREALKIAQQALYNTCLGYHNQGKNYGDDPNYDKASDALDVVNKALASPSTPVDGVGAEPVAVVIGSHVQYGPSVEFLTDNVTVGMKLYAAPLASPEAEARLRERALRENLRQINDEVRFVQDPVCRNNLAYWVQNTCELFGLEPFPTEARLAQAERGPAVTEAWLRDTAMNVMLATEVEEAIRILEAALRPQSAAGEEGK